MMRRMSSQGLSPGECWLDDRSWRLLQCLSLLYTAPTQMLQHRAAALLYLSLPLSLLNRHTGVRQARDDWLRVVPPLHMIDQQSCQSLPWRPSLISTTAAHDSYLFLLLCLFSSAICILSKLFTKTEYYIVLYTVIFGWIWNVCNVTEPRIYTKDLPWFPFFIFIRAYFIH